MVFLEEAGLFTGLLETQAMRNSVSEKIVLRAITAMSSAKKSALLFMVMHRAKHSLSCIRLHRNSSGKDTLTQHKTGTHRPDHGRAPVQAQAGAQAHQWLDAGAVPGHQVLDPYFF